MKRAYLVKYFWPLTWALLIVLLTTPSDFSQQTELINNVKVIEMVKAGIGDAVIIPKISRSEERRVGKECRL